MVIKNKMQDKNPCVDQLFCVLSVLDIWDAGESSVFMVFSYVMVHQTIHNISIILIGYVEDTSTITLQVSSPESPLILYS